jgi:dipeptidyl aminopeptidase/acylaminoacyl peptidase
VSYAIADGGDGSVLLAAASPGTPRSVWRIDPTGKAPPIQAYVPEALRSPEVARFASKVRTETFKARDGLDVPMVIFDPPAPDRRLTVLWVHGGNQGREDISPRWKPEIEYLTLSGYTVAAVNYRGSTGWGRSFREGATPELQGLDVEDALGWLRKQPWVEPDRIFILSVCYGSSIITAQVINGIAGFVHLMGAPANYLAARKGAPLLWLYGDSEDGADRYPRMARALRASGVEVETVALSSAHDLIKGAARLVAAHAILKFLERHR